MEVRSAIQAVVLEHRHRYGYRVAAELRRRGMAVNHKRVARLMRADNLLAIQPKTFVVTTESEHGFEVYLNLAKRMNLSGINQLWVADITFIRLRSEFVYLAVILDAFSRKVVGWELGRTLTARLAVAALEKAIAERRPAAGLVHHSDRGVQYASGEYIGVLAHHQMLPSMSRPANPYDNRVPQRQVFVAGVKRQLRELYEDPEAGGGPCQHVPRYRRSARPHRRVHRPVLQSAAAALRARISDSGRVRSLGSTRVRLARSEHKFFQAWGDLSIEWKSKRRAG
jgi:hypothetical protein